MLCVVVMASAWSRKESHLLNEPGATGAMEATQLWRKGPEWDASRRRKALSRFFRGANIFFQNISRVNSDEICSRI